MPSRAGKVRIKTPIDELQRSGILICLDKRNVGISPLELFCNNNLTEVEIGCGKGGVLLHRAANCSFINIIGIDWLQDYAALTADRIYRHRIQNARVLHGDAADIINYLRQETIWRIYILFPDPWPKRKHWKRRLITQRFMESLARRLKIGGTIYIATDHEAYFHKIRHALNNTRGLATVTGSDQLLYDNLLRYSNYARKYATRRKNVYTLVALRYLR